jgi:SAM-dependent methyltransferase
MQSGPFSKMTGTRVKFLYPRRLTCTDDRADVEQALTDFYLERPEIYHVEKIREEEFDQYARFVARFAPAKAKLLEFGAGSWRLPLTLHKHGFEVVGCDIFSAEDLARYSAHLPETGVKLAAYDGNSLPFEDESFDVVSSRNVFEHIVDVERSLLELHRVLKPGGLFIISGPNWSGPNNPARACIQLFLKGKKRYWQFESRLDALLGIPRTLGWYLEAQLSPQPTFLLIYPRMRDGRIAFESSDDDAVHLCQPVSFKRWFSQHNYTVELFNRFEAESTFGRYFNTLFPALATTNRLVFRKPRAH